MESAPGNTFLRDLALGAWNLHSWTDERRSGPLGYLVVDTRLHSAVADLTSWLDERRRGSSLGAAYFGTLHARVGAVCAALDTYTPRLLSQDPAAIGTYPPLTGRISLSSDLEQFAKYFRAAEKECDSLHTQALRTYESKSSMPPLEDTTEVVAAAAHPQRRWRHVPVGAPYGTFGQELDELTGRVQVSVRKLRGLAPTASYTYSIVKGALDDAAAAASAISDMTDLTPTSLDSLHASVRRLPELVGLIQPTTMFDQNDRYDYESLRRSLEHTSHSLAKLIAKIPEVLAKLEPERAPVPPPAPFEAWQGTYSNLSWDDVSESIGEDDEACGVCYVSLLEPLHTGVPLSSVRLSCGDLFHTTCIQEKLQSEPSCPLCGTAYDGTMESGQPYLADIYRETMRRHFGSGSARTTTDTAATATEDEEWDRSSAGLWALDLTVHDYLQLAEDEFLTALVAAYNSHFYSWLNHDAGVPTSMLATDLAAIGTYVQETSESIQQGQYTLTDDNRQLPAHLQALQSELRDLETTVNALATG